MRKNSEARFEKLFLLSRRIFYFSLALMLAPFAIIISDNIWLGRIVSILFTFGVFLVLISWLIPGILLLFNAPWFALAWLRGIYPSFFPATPWDNLPSGKKFAVYFYSILFFIVTVFGVIATIINKSD